MSAPPPRWPTGPGRSSPPSAPWAPTAPTLVGRAAIGASGLGVGGGLAGAGGGGGAMGASASAQQPACERAWAAIRVRGAAARRCACGLSTPQRLTQSHPNPLSSSQENEWLSEEHVCRRHTRAQGFWAAANTASRASRAKQVGRILWSVTRSWGGGRRRSRPVQRGRRVGGTRVVWGHRHGGRQQAAARAIRTQGMGGTPVDAGIHRARKESVCVRAQPVVQARRWRAFVCLWPRECVAQP